MSENTPHPPPSPSNEAPLEGWKEIAAQLKRGVRTVKRWEKHEGLPVHRHLHQARSTVYAYPSELDTWWAQRAPSVDKPAVAFWRPAPVLSLAAVLLLTLLTVASGPLLNPPGILASDSGGMVARQVWAGPDVDTTGAPSPDGRYLSFVDWSTGDLAVHDFTSGKNLYLTSQGGAYRLGEAASSVFSPDGQQVAYGWQNYNDRKSELRIVALAGSDSRVIYQSSELAYLAPAAWSADGKRILATFERKDRTNQIVIVSVADGSVRVLKTLDWHYPGRMSFSPDARYLAYDFPQSQGTEARDIFVLAADGSREVRLVSHRANDLLLGSVPDGNRILFASDRTGSPSGWIIPVAEGNPAGPPEMVKPDLGRIVPIGFAGTGAYYYALVTRVTDVFVAALDPLTGGMAEPPRPIPQRSLRLNMAPDWSPDGKHLAYATEPVPIPMGAERRAIVIRSLETGEERELLPGMRYSYELRWSPDGRKFLLVGADSRNRYGLHIANAQSGEITTFIPGEYWGEWSLDGKRVFYARNPDETTKGRPLIVRDLGTGEEQVLYPGLLGSGLALSPDGEKIAFSVFDKANSADLSAALKVMPTRGGEAKELLRLKEGSFGAIAWTKTGRDLLFVRRFGERKSELWRISAEGGEAQKLGPSVLQLTQISVHPDGSRIAFNAGEGKVEIWVLENFLPALKAAK